MCGIVGYLGKKNVSEVLIKGLSQLEYRGYDSAGIALNDGEQLQIIKKVGRVKELEDKIKETDLIDAHYGIAHTRWATNGGVSDENAHPHNVGRVTLVHNGIIENANKLRNELIEEGYTFASETDTEVVAALLDKELKSNDVVKAIIETTKQLTGSFALVIMIDGEKDKLYATRKDSPFIIGLGEDEMVMASDIPAILDYTNKYMLLDTYDVAVIDQHNVVVYDETGKEIEKEIKETDLLKEEAGKNGYPHFMLKEMMEEPIVVENLIKYYEDKKDELDLSKYEEIHIVACGSAMYAGMVGKSLIEKYAHIPTVVEVASEYRYQEVLYTRKTLVILISQSGETADTIAAMNKVKEMGIDTLAIVNAEYSTIANNADKVLFIKAGPEIAVATTKAYILQTLVLTLLALETAHNKNLLSTASYEQLLVAYKNLPKQIKGVLEKRDLYKNLAKEIYQQEDVFFIGRGIDYSMSMEGSLKIKEISYIHSETFQAGELKHGTISLIDEGTPVIAIITDKKLEGKTYANVEEVAARGANVILVTTEDIDAIHNYKENKIVVPAVSEFIQPLVVVPGLQLLAYEIALLRGCDIDKPKNLAKSVTVE